MAKEIELSNKAKAEIRQILEDLPITLADIAEKAGIRPEEVSRSLSPASPNQQKGYAQILKIIKKKRPDVDIEAIINS